MTSEDRRVQRTRASLHQALIALLLEQPYDSITVQQILDRANVGRSTFYTHFQDKDELLVHGVRGLQATLAAAQQRGRSPRGGAENIIAFSRTMFEHAHEYRKVYHALVLTRVWPHLRQRIQNALTDLVRKECNAEMKRVRRPGSKLPAELFVHYVGATFMTVLTWWIDHNSALSPAEIDQVFRALVMPTMRSAGL